jgi:hypothetical protein
MTVENKDCMQGNCWTRHNQATSNAMGYAHEKMQ